MKMTKATSSVPELNASFPLWPEAVRALPTSFARSALFTVGSVKHKRAQCKETTIATSAGVEMIFTGEELRQDDEDVYLQLLHLSRGQAAGLPVVFGTHAMLIELNWATNGQGYNRLKATLDRMQSGKIKIQAKEGRKGFVGSLLSSWGWKEEDEGSLHRAKMFVRFEPSILELFGFQPYTQLQWAERNSLVSTMAKWLHTFLITQPQTRGILLTELLALSGSKASTMTVFRQTLRGALDELKEKKCIAEWRLEREILFVALNGEQIMRLLPRAVIDIPDLKSLRTM